MRTIIFMLLLFMVSGVHAGQFDGKYRLNKQWDCKSVGMDGGAMEIRGGKLHGVESLCLMTNPTKIRGMDAVLYDLKCSGEGETWSDRLMLLKQKNGIYHIRNGWVSKWERCPR